MLAMEAWSPLPTGSNMSSKIQVGLRFPEGVGAGVGAGGLSLGDGPGGTGIGPGSDEHDDGGFFE
jgi:hypothetical protein